MILVRLWGRDQSTRLLVPATFSFCVGDTLTEPEIKTVIDFTSLIQNGWILVLDGINPNKLSIEKAIEMTDQIIKEIKTMIEIIQIGTDDKGNHIHLVRSLDEYQDRLKVNWHTLGSVQKTTKKEQKTTKKEQKVSETARKHLTELQEKQEKQPKTIPPLLKMYAKQYNGSVGAIPSVIEQQLREWYTVEKKDDYWTITLDNPELT